MALSSPISGLSHISMTLTGKDTIATSCIISSRGGKAECVTRTCLKYVILPVFILSYSHEQTTQWFRPHSISALHQDMEKVETVRFPHVGDAGTQADGQRALEFVIFNANVPLRPSNRLAVKVQRAATENKSHGSSCLAKQRQIRRERWHVKEWGGGARKESKEGKNRESEME